MSRAVRWMDFPKKKIFSIEYFGETELGKTHNALTFPNVAICDTISEGEVHQVAEKFNNPRVFRARNFDDVRRFVNYCIANPKIESIAIDSGADLREMAEAEYLGFASPEELHVKHRGEKKPSVYSPKHGGVEYRHVNNKIDELVNKVKRANKYLIITSRVKDEWIKEDAGGETRFVKSGRKVYDGYNKFEYGYGLSVRLWLVKGITIDGNTYFEDYVFAKVIKNRFVPKRVQKPYIFNHTYQGLVEDGELFEIWCKNYDENKCDINKCVVCPNHEPKDLLEEAKAYLRRIGFLKDESKENRK